MRTTVTLAAVLLATATALAGGGKEITTTLLKDLKWTPLDAKAGDKGPQVSVVVGDMKAKGKPIAFYLKVPPDGKPGPHTHTSDDYGVVVQGTFHNYKAPGTDEGAALTVGANWFQPGGQPHDNHCEASSKDGCIVYVYMEKGFDFKPWEEKKPAGKEPAKK
jgi:hypothetical protein